MQTRTLSSIDNITQLRYDAASVCRHGGQIHCHQKRLRRNSFETGLMISSNTLVAALHILECIGAGISWIIDDFLVHELTAGFFTGDYPYLPLPPGGSHLDFHAATERRTQTAPGVRSFEQARVRSYRRRVCNTEYSAIEDRHFREAICNTDYLSIGDSHFTVA